MSEVKDETKDVQAEVAVVEEKVSEVGKLDLQTKVSEADVKGFKQTEISEDGQELIENVVRISRVAKVVKGGRRFSFSAVSVVGDGEGQVGVGLGKANEVPNAIQKSFEAAKKNMIQTVIVDGTVPHEVYAKVGAGKILLKPASAGTGIKAGGSVRAVVEAVGIKNILSKSLGSNNPVNVVKATIGALSQMKSIEEICESRGRTRDEIYK